MFGRDSCLRPGWLTIGPDLSNSNYDWSAHQAFFKEGLTTGCTERIEQLRPKSPPPKAGRGGRGGGRGKRGVDVVSRRAVDVNKNCGRKRS